MGDVRVLRDNCSTAKADALAETGGSRSFARMSDLLQPGSPVPRFVLAAAGGQSVSNETLGSGRCLLIFYPGDDTPTCTNELVDFSNKSNAFRRLNVKLIGVSRDSPESHAKFKAKRGLTIDLATDATGEAVAAFGAWGEKTLFGRKYMGILRTTVLIADCRVVRVWRVARVAGHAAEALAAAHELARH